MSTSRPEMRVVLSAEDDRWGNLESGTGRRASPTLELPEGERQRVRPQPGQVIDGAYQIVSTIGEGGMGVVVLAHDLRLDRRVAIKLIRPEHVASPGATRRLLAEARAMAKVHHPNVVQIYAFGETNGTPYLVMEHVPGPSLDTWLHTHACEEPLPVDLALGVLDQICRGVEAIHRARTVHRDLKPGNILVGPAFRFTVTDFGLARPRGLALRPEGVVGGTPAYMAPEVVHDDVPDPDLATRSDVYSLGVIAFELLTGRLPFEARTVTEMMRAHAYEPPPAPSEVRDGLATAFDAPLLAALAKVPGERTPTAEALRLALHAAGACRRPAGPRRILVADDDPAYRNLITRILARAFPGCVVESVEDGASALTAIDTCRPDLAVIDLDMPGLNGIELTAALRARPSGAKLPILVATGVTSATDWELLQRLGVDGIVVKPFDPDQLASLGRALTQPGPGRL